MSGAGSHSILFLASGPRRLLRCVVLALFLGVVTELALVGVGVLLMTPRSPRSGLSARSLERTEEGQNVVWLRRSGMALTSTWAVTVTNQPVFSSSGPDPREVEAFVPTWAKERILPWYSGDAAWPKRGSPGQQTMLFTAGWPAPAFHAYKPHDATTLRGACVYAPAGSTALPTASGVLPNGVYVVPFLPIWHGLVYDTAILAGGWWLLLLGWRDAAQWWRARRGRCAACGYPRSGLGSGDACPECGGVERAA